MADTTKREDKPAGLDKLDRLFRDVVSVSNKAVQRKMKAEKQARKRKRDKD
jgi:hypothetical protein